MESYSLSRNSDLEKHVSVVTPQDEALYNSYVDDGSTSYGDSWLYHQQAALNSWYKYHDGDTLITVTTKQKGAYPYVLVRPRGKHAAKKTYNLAKKMVDMTNQPVIVKKIAEDEKELYYKQGFEDYRDDEGWGRAYRYDDDTFPEIVIDLDEMASTAAQGYKDLRYYLRKFDKNDDLKMVVYNPDSQYFDASTAVKVWAREFIHRHPEETFENVYAQHTKYLEHLPQGTDGIDRFAYLFYLKGQPVAFTLAAKISKVAVGMFADVCDTKYRGLAETVTFKTFKKAKDAGYKYANFGGCENSALDHFHKRFKPVDVKRFTHVVLYPRLHYKQKIFD